MAEIPLPSPPLRDDSLVLRPWRQSDAGALVEACQDPDIPRWTAVPSPYGERDAVVYLARTEADRLVGRELGLAVTEEPEGTLLGSCALARFDWRDRKAEIGYWVAHDARRRAVGSRATRLLARWGLEQLGLERVELLANPANEASQRLAERAGFSREGLLRSYRRRKGEREDLIMFSLLRGDL